MIERKDITATLQAYDQKQAERQAADRLVKKVLGRRIYVIRWTDVDGHKQARTFFATGTKPKDTGREKAILFLNHLILDCGICSAKLRTERTY